MRHLTEHFPATFGGKRMILAGIYSIEGYIYIFSLEDGINEAATASDPGYSVRNKDSYFIIKVNNMEGSILHRRKRLYACDTFLKLKWLCLLMPRTF